MVPLLICKGADVHAREDSGDTLLHVAMSILEETQCFPTTQALVEAGCDPLAVNSANKQPIDIAVSQGFLSVAEYLLSHSSNTLVSIPPNLLLIALRCREASSKVQLLMNHGGTIPYEDHLVHVLSGSIEEDECLQATQMLCQAGHSFVAPDAVLHIAITRRFTSVVDYLLSRNVPLPSDILFFALRSRFSDVFNDRTTIKWIPLITLLVHKGADIHARDPDGNTILQRAIWIARARECLELTKIFTEAGCDTRARDHMGRTPLELATARGYSEVAEYLRRRTAVPQQRSLPVFPHTPLPSPVPPPHPPPPKLPSLISMQRSIARFIFPSRTQQIKPDDSGA